MNLAAIAPYPLPDHNSTRHNRLNWQLDAARTALLVHDMQLYFLRPYDQGDPVDKAVDNIQRLLLAARGAGVPVIHTRQPPNQDPRKRGLLADLWGPGLGSRPDDADIVPRLLPAPREKVITKHRYSAFYGTDLADHLHTLQRSQLLVTGVYAHLGCLLTCADAFTHDIEPFLVADATCDFDAEHHTWALRYAATRCAVVTVTTDALPALHGRTAPASVPRHAPDSGMDELHRTPDGGERTHPRHEPPQEAT